jgi:hypothetical protein
MPELLPLTAADGACSTSETTSEKTKKIQIRPPGLWWSNRVYPQNHALLNPRSHGEVLGAQAFDWSSKLCERGIYGFAVFSISANQNV